MKSTRYLSPSPFISSSCFDHDFFGSSCGGAGMFFATILLEEEERLTNNNMDDEDEMKTHVEACVIM